MNALDYRLIAEEMRICFFSDAIGPGLPIWLPNGVLLREQIEGFVKNLENEAGFERVASPHIADGKLYEKSGHLEKFSENMFPPLHEEAKKRLYYLKPMNCPHHHLVYASSLRSYRSLPIRLAEFGQVYRYENSGSLHGIARVRSLCQNDGHIYVDPAQAKQEILEALAFQKKCLEAFALKNYRFRLSKRGKEENSPAWDICEGILRDALQESHLPFFEAEAEAAFYGPKIDVQMFIGQKEESIASIQLDFLSAERFALFYVDKNGERKNPWIIHRAPIGSLERFLGLLLYHHQGKLPAWLCPIQLYLLPLSEEEWPFCASVRDKLRSKGIHVKLEHSGNLSKRIREAYHLRPFAQLVIGPKELASGKIVLQMRGENRELWLANLEDELIALIKASRP